MEPPRSFLKGAGSYLLPKAEVTSMETLRSISARGRLLAEAASKLAQESLSEAESDLRGNGRGGSVWLLASMSGQASRRSEVSQHLSFRRLPTSPSNIHVLRAAI